MFRKGNSGSVANNYLHFLFYRSQICIKETNNKEDYTPASMKISDMMSMLDFPVDLIILSKSLSK